MLIRHRPSNMSLSNSPVQTYVPWRPNSQVVKFFDDMSKRRIAQARGDTMKITNVSSPSTLKYGKKKKTYSPSAGPGVGNSPVSDSIVAAALSHTGDKKRAAPRKRVTRSKSSARATSKSTGKKKRKTKKKSTSSGRLENKIKNAKI